MEADALAKLEGRELWRKHNAAVAANDVDVFLN
jgi:hypothetical protein